MMMVSIRRASDDIDGNYGGALPRVVITVEQAGIALISTKVTRMASWISPLLLFISARQGAIFISAFISHTELRRQLPAFIHI